MTITGLTVMAIDDDVETVQLLAALLDTPGMKFLAVTDARAALTSIAEARPDVLLVDIEMPGCDGVELIRRLRAQPEERGGRTPAATLTACLATPKERARWARAGFQLHVPKPFDPAGLFVTLAALSRMRVNPRRRAGPGPRRAA
jgi:CheY-like chemotaxis protein